jgi:GNAT superfamily N-acetyltransferase
MSIELFIVENDSDLRACFPAFLELRPHLEEDAFMAQVKRQQLQNYQVLALRHEGKIQSLAGFRMAEFLAWGKILYIDDLSTLSTARAQGFAGRVLDYLIEHAKQNQCQAVHLDTGYTRHEAHRVYLNKGFEFNAHHLALKL